ncbi:MAG: GNAT family N-acetyltransferase [Rhodobiaceae bacterium]|nr:GNAT family N-acetyltransferase [Rhodobiaceae bacterium]
MSPAGSPVVRDAVPEDLPETLDLLFANWRQTYAPLIGAAAVERLLVDQHSVEVLQTQLDARPVAFLSALLDGRLVGHAYAYDREDGCYLERLHVASGLRGHGLGKTLLHGVLARCPAGTGVSLEAIDGNAAAVRFYERAGFAVVRRVSAEQGSCGAPAIVMRRPAATP